MSDLAKGVAVLCWSVLLTSCASAIGDADAGPNPGGGFYDGPNLNVGHINPSHGGYTTSHIRVLDKRFHSSMTWPPRSEAVTGAGGIGAPHRAEEDREGAQAVRCSGNNGRTNLRPWGPVVERSAPRGKAIPIVRAWQPENASLRSQ